jgi:transcriptional regulator with XRE-family HTH domain
MQHKITTVTELGTLVRATRKSVAMRIDDLAATSNLSKQFVNDVELGKPGVQLGKVLQVLQELGVHMYIDVPYSVNEQLANARNQIANTTERRNARAHGQSALENLSPLSATETPRRTRKRVL